jgi:hypothetical protein
MNRVAQWPSLQAAVLSVRANSLLLISKPTHNQFLKLVSGCSSVSGLLRRINRFVCYVGVEDLHILIEDNLSKSIAHVCDSNGTRAN